MVTGIPGFLGFLEIFSLAGDMVTNRNTISILLNHILIVTLSTIINLCTITSERRDMVMVWGMEADIMGDTMADMDAVIMDIILTVTITKSIVITMDMVMFIVMDMNLTINRN